MFTPPLQQKKKVITKSLTYSFYQSYIKRHIIYFKNMIHQPKKTEALWLWIDGRKIHLALYNQDCHMPFVGYTFIFFFFLGGKSNQSIHNLISEILKYRSNIVSSLRHVCDYSLLHFMGTVTRRRKESIKIIGTGKA